ncbi:hypothetical protein AVEN_250719-1 [Araneus ventricosus]|uniref:Uncharacterized protein n=1 Tax=Araneus ventricosus TaxID=182803 RepID=A0A4Y2N703_ARAVE|nr:hypothetical protein AVEN_250719-1 [Araneus ventricosus]
MSYVRPFRAHTVDVVCHTFGLFVPVRSESHIIRSAFLCPYDRRSMSYVRPVRARTVGVVCHMFGLFVPLLTVSHVIRSACSCPYDRRRMCPYGRRRMLCDEEKNRIVESDFATYAAHYIPLYFFVFLNTSKGWRLSESILF